MLSSWNDPVRVTARARWEHQVEASRADGDVDRCARPVSFSVGVNETGVCSFDDEMVAAQVKNAGTAKELAGEKPREKG